MTRLSAAFMLAFVATACVVGDNRRGPKAVAAEYPFSEIEVVEDGREAVLALADGVSIERFVDATMFCGMTPGASLVDVQRELGAPRVTSAGPETRHWFDAPRCRLVVVETIVPSSVNGQSETHSQMRAVVLDSAYDRSLPEALRKLIREEVALESLTLTADGARGGGLRYFVVDGRIDSVALLPRLDSTGRPVGYPTLGRARGYGDR